MSDPSPVTELFRALEASDRVLLTGPAEPDGDSVGACLALQRLLRRRGVAADVAGEPADRYAWMPGARDMIPDQDVDSDYDAVVVLDGDRHRLGKGTLAAFRNADVKGIVDHHASTRHDGYTHPWIARHATSTCEMLYDAIVERGEPIDRDLAVLLYVGAIFDTGGFRYSNTTPATLRMAAHLLGTGFDHARVSARILMEHTLPGLRVAGHVFTHARHYLDGALSIGAVSRADADALGICRHDLEGLVDQLVYTEGVEVAVLLFERELGDVKASLRSRGGVDVARVAQQLVPSGGGHAKAAGAVLECDIDQARDLVVGTVARSLGTSRAIAK